MDATTVLAIIGITSGLASAIFAFIANSRTAKTAEKKVDAEAYDRAQKMYAAALDDFDAQLRRLRAENQELIKANQRLQAQISGLQTLVTRLRRQMLDRGLTPDVLSDKFALEGGD